jgi:hypothetical protein
MLVGVACVSTATAAVPKPTAANESHVTNVKYFLKLFIIFL